MCLDSSMHPSFLPLLVKALGVVGGCIFLALVVVVQAMLRRDG